MGAMVIAQIPTYGRQVQAYEVIDGQQRLTTFQLMLAALRDVARDTTAEYADEVQKYLLNEGVMETPQVERFKLWPSAVDRLAFTTLAFPQNPVGTAVENHSGHVNPAVAAYAFFKDQIERFVHTNNEYDSFKMEKLFEALKRGLAVVSIELESNDEPQTIFETLNSRGVDLAVGDLLRNFIFQRAAGGGLQDGSLTIDSVYEKYWLPLDGWFWREGDTRGRLTRPRLDWLIADHLAMKTTKLVVVESLYEAYRKWIIDEKPFASIESELESLTASADVYRRVLEEDDQDPLGRFGKFARSFDVSTAMPLILYLATDSRFANDLPHALNAIESYIIRRDVCGLSTGGYNRFFVEAIAQLRESNSAPLQTLERYFLNKTKETVKWPSDDEWRQSWLSREQYKPSRQSRIRYILEKIEESKRTRANEVVTIRSDLTLEHIMPVKWREYWPIASSPSIPVDGIDIEQLSKESVRDNRINTMGNLTLLTQTLNSSISNGAFSIKIPAVRAQSALVLNRELHDFDRWNDETISTRGAQLFEVAKTIWPIAEISPDATAN